MQTFLPHPNFASSLACLDYRRLGKQRVETGQILTALLDRSPEARGGWASHPAAKMWRGHESALGMYMSMAIWEWELRGYRNTMISPYTRELTPDPLFRWSSHMTPVPRIKVPSWLGDDSVHSTHRARLLFKDPEHYGSFGWTEEPRTEEEGYKWPV